MSGTLAFKQQRVVVVVSEKERVEAVRLIGCRLATVGGGRESGRSDELPLTTDNPFLRQRRFSLTSMTSKFDPSNAQNAIEVFICFPPYLSLPPELTTHSRS